MDNQILPSNSTLEEKTNIDRLPTPSISNVDLNPQHNNQKPILGNNLSNQPPPNQQPNQPIFNQPPQFNQQTNQPPIFNQPPPSQQPNQQPIFNQPPPNPQSNQQPNQPALNQPQNISVPIWTKQTIERLHHLLYSHTNIPLSSSESMFLNLWKQSEKETQTSQLSLSQFFMMVSLWGLSRIHTTEDLESRRQYGLFINHLQDAENSLLKAVQIHNKTKKELAPIGIPPSKKVFNLPITTQQITTVTL